MKEIKKKDIENLSYKDIANKILENNKEGMNTLDLFTNIVKLLELPFNTVDLQIGDFYTSMTTDKRFVMVDGLWDLRNRHTSDKVLSNNQDDEDEEENYDEIEEDEDEIEEEYEEDNIDSDRDYDDTDDDGLGDLVVLDEDDMDRDN